MKNWRKAAAAALAEGAAPTRLAEATATSATTAIAMIAAVFLLLITSPLQRRRDGRFSVSHLQSKRKERSKLAS